MPPRPDATREAIKRAYISGDDTIDVIAARYGISASTISARARREAWPRRSERNSKRTAGSDAPPPRVAGTLNDRRLLVRRLYKAISTKLKLLEKRMEKSMSDIAAGRDASAADHERDTRAIGALIKTLENVTEYEAGIDSPTGGEPAATATAADLRELTDEAERCRRELAERLERLVRARRG